MSTVRVSETGGEVAGASGKRCAIVFDDRDTETLHETTETALVTERLDEAEISEIGSDGARHSAREVNATIWQRGERKIADGHTEQANEDAQRLFGTPVAAGKCLHDVGGARPRGRTRLASEPGMNVLDPASRQDVLDTGKSVSGPDEVRKAKIRVVTDRHADVASFGWSHVASRSKVMDHCGIEAGSDTDHELPRIATSPGPHHDLAQT